MNAEIVLHEDLWFALPSIYRRIADAGPHVISAADTGTFSVTERVVVVDEHGDEMDLYELQD